MGRKFPICAATIRQSNKSALLGTLTVANRVTPLSVKDESSSFVLLFLNARCLAEQLDDGGWNCDYPEYQGIKVKHSSFMSTIEPLWAYSEIPRQKWTRKMKRSIEKSAEFMLMHRLYKADHHEWMPMNRTITTLHFPMYYYYDLLHGLRVLTKLGYGDDERMRDSAHLVMSKRRPDGKWVLESDWFNEPDSTTRWLTPMTGAKSPGAADLWGNSIEGWKKFELEPVGKPSKWVTLNCYRALTRTGDIKIPN